MNPPLTKYDFMNSRWQEVVNNSGRKDCLSYSDAFSRKSQEAKALGNVREQAVFEILTYITNSAIKPAITEEFFSEIFADLTDEHLDFLADIAPEVSDPELQARVADILWSRQRIYQMAQRAISAYLQSATELEDPEQWLFCAERIERAFRLSHKIDFGIEVVTKHIEEVIDRCNGEDSSLFSVTLMELLQENRSDIPAKYTDKYAALAEKAAILAESSHDWNRARNYWNIKAQWHRLEKDSGKVRDALMKATETYVQEAEDALRHDGLSPYSTASQHLLKAIEAFRNLPGTREETVNAKIRAEEVHKKLIQYQENSLKEYFSVTHEIDISKQVEQARAYVRGKKFEDAIFALAMLGTSHSKLHLRQEAQKRSLLSRFFPSMIVNDMGKVVASQSSNIDDEETAILFEMYRLGIEFQNLHAKAFIEPARYEIGLEHSVRVKDFFPIVQNSPFVPQGREYLFAKGLYAGFNGDFLSSTHILIPQIENSVRYLLAQQGAITSGLAQGIQKERYLTSTLYPQNYPEIVSIFDEDTLFDLQGLLVQSSGSNLRNRMAHGLISDIEFSNASMSYLWWITLRLCYLPILDWAHKVEQSNPWIKFAGMFQDDPLFDEFVEDIAAYRRELDADTHTDQSSSEQSEPV